MWYSRMPNVQTTGSKRGAVQLDRIRQENVIHTDTHDFYYYNKRGKKKEKNVD